MIEIFTKSISTVAVLHIMMINLSNTKWGLPYIFKFIFSSLIITIALCFFNITDIVLNLYFLVMLFLFMYLKNRDGFISFCYAAFCMALSIISNMIAVAIFYMITGTSEIDTGSLPNVIFLYLTYSLIALTISGIIGYIIRKKGFSPFERIQKKYIVYVSLGSIVVLVFFYVQLFMEPHFDNPKTGSLFNSVISVLYLVFLLVAVYMFMRGVKQDLDAKHNKELVKNMGTYISELEATYSEMRKFRHDYRNILLGVYNYIAENDMEKIKAYFDDRLLPISENMEHYNSTLDRLSNIQIMDLKSVVSIKLLQAQEENIVVHVEAPDTIHTVCFDPVGLIRIMGILFDNAIEAARDSKEKIIEFAVYENKEVVTFLLVNSYEGDLPNMAQMRKPGFSTKGKGRGIGLSTVDKLVMENKNSVLLSYVKDGKFVQEFKISNT